MYACVYGKCVRTQTLNMRNKRRQKNKIQINLTKFPNMSISHTIYLRTNNTSTQKNTHIHTDKVNCK